jgi:tetratricopeptide (TPR) repeat protein
MRYAAFLSYSHGDSSWAQWLHRRLENYRVPKRLIGTPGRDGPIGARLGTIFRDRDELPTSDDLGTTIRAALAESAALIVICSPAAARSRWVHGEIEAFQALGRGDRIACFIVAGEPGATAMETACFPPALTAARDDGSAKEPLAADARAEGDGRDRAFLRLVAGLLGVSYDALARREAQRRQRRMLAITTASVLGMAIGFGLAATAWIARNDAQRRQAQAEDILGFMLGDLREKLTKVGRLDLMRAVDDKATGYFATLQPRDLSDRALEEQARSLTGIGQVRLDEGKHDAAMRAFREAYDRSSALYDRAPRNGQRLFDRAQAEYWIGLVFWRQGRYDDAQTWLTRYRDSALKLAAMNPDNFDWQREVAYGRENLAVLDQSRGRNKEAEQGFRSELALYHGWLKKYPNDTGLRAEAANAASFLGSLALADGRLDEALARFREVADGYSRNRKTEPDNAEWKKNWLDTQIHLAHTQATQGKFADARRSVAEASALAATLAAHDPSNREWQHALGYSHWWTARLLSPTDPERAVQEARAAEDLFAAGHRADPKDKAFLRWMAKSELLLAELGLQRGDVAGAGNMIGQAEAKLAPMWKEEPSDDVRILLARALWLRGMAAQAGGRGSAAQDAWSRAEHLLRDRLGNPPEFDRLELLVRVLQAQHRDADANAYLARLEESGYVPLPPWTSSASLTATTTH